MRNRIYFDFNSTTPLHWALKEYCQEQLERFGNPSSIHSEGRNAKAVISAARIQIAEYLKCDPFEILFTGSGSESNNLALKGLLGHRSDARNEIMCSAVEHPSVLRPLEYLAEAFGYRLIKINVNRSGEIDLNQYEAALSDKTKLVSVQLVNNETGTIFPVKKMAKMAHEKGALFHSDMVQALGKMPLDIRSFDVDVASFSGHKFYSLKGAGLLYIKPQVHLTPLIHGGGQERGRRAGTENVLAIGCLGEAVRVLGPCVLDMTEKVASLRNLLEMRILNEIPGSQVTGFSAKRVCNTTNISFSGIDGESLLINLDMSGIAVSTGAACSSGAQEASPVLRAMGLSLKEASQSMRLSLGWTTQIEEIERFMNVLKAAVAQIRDANTSDLDMVL